MNFLKLSLIIFSVLIYQKTNASTEEDLFQYESSVNSVDELIEKTKSDLRSCPGTNLVISCGNTFCEPHLNESVTNCPADCLDHVSVRSYNNITLCQGYSETQIPQSKEEVVDLVKKAIFEGKHVRAIGASHSATDVMCSTGLLIPMEKLNQVLGLETLNGIPVVRTQAGITVYKLSEWLHSKGYALDGLPHMGFRDVTVGGAIATASHGSTPKHHGVISNIIEAIELVDGQGKIHYFEKEKTDSKTFKALSASLGLLGIVTEVKFRIQPQFNLGVQITYHSEQEVFSNGLINSIKDCDYGQFNWFPGLKKLMKTCGKKTQELATIGANNELLNPSIPKFIVKPFKKILQYGACSNRIMCAIEQVRWWQYKLQPPMVSTNENGKKSFNHYLVGPSHRMVSSHLIKEQAGFFQMDWEIAVPASKAEAAFKAIREHMTLNKTCLPLVGVFIRFAPSEDQTLLAHTVSDQNDWIKNEPAVFFEMPVYVPVGMDHKTFDQYEKQYVDFAKLMIEQYSGRPHWGKNRQWAFDLAIKAQRYGNNINEFQSVINQLDPHGTFSNEFGEKLGFTWK
jgi:FAD/FMN-containing dehydrogenase